MSLYFAIFRCKLLYVVISCYMSPYVMARRDISLYITICRYMSRYVAICRYFSCKELFVCWFVISSAMSPISPVKNPIFFVKRPVCPVTHSLSEKKRKPSNCQIPGRDSRHPSLEIVVGCLI